MKIETKAYHKNNRFMSQENAVDFSNSYNYRELTINLTRLNREGKLDERDLCILLYFSAAKYIESEINQLISEVFFEDFVKALRRYIN